MKLFSPKTYDSRPITDMVKESLFDVLFKYNLPHGAVVADLFAGVGSLGLEALSRGARFVTFVEKNPKIITVLKKNIQKTGFVKESKVIQADVFGIGAPISSNSGPYGLVFIDPPYIDTHNVDIDSSLSGLFNQLEHQTSISVIVIVRTHRSNSLLDRYGCFEVMERRRWGTMAITILCKN